MAKYEMAMTAFGLNRGDTFESNDPGWADRAKSGFVTRVGGLTKSEVLADTTPLSSDELEARRAAGDKNPVHPGESYVEKIPVDDGQ